MSAECERITTAADAVQRVINSAAACGFTVDYHTVGQQLCTTTCHIKGPAGLTAVGRGKGYGLQSIASAVFESFEHYHHKYEDKNKQLASLFLDLSAADEELRYASPDFGLIFGITQIPLTCLKFEGIRNQWSPIDFPVILTDPAYEPSNAQERDLIESTRFYRYATNSGTAAGLSIEEAVLHGLLEVIERDAIGMAFIHSVLRSMPRPVRVIMQTSIPYRCKKIISDLTDEVDCELTLWDITSDLQVPCVLCALTVGNPPIHRFFGSGASLCAEYAVERAVLEALQGYHIQMLLGISLQKPLTRNVERMSLFQRCELSAGYFAYRGGESITHFSELPTLMNSEKPFELQTQIDAVADILAANNIKSYYRLLHRDFVCVAQVVAPRLERLYLISHGLPIAPASRGRAARAGLI